MPEINIAGIALEAHWWWLIIAVALGIFEIVIPGIFLIWLAAAAAITGVLAAFLPIPLAGQMLLFAGLALAATWWGRRWYAANPVTSSDPLLNDRAARLIGEIVTVVDPIAGGSGRVKVGDGVWNANGPDAPVGTRMRVTGSERGSLTVEPQ